MLISVPVVLNVATPASSDPDDCVMALPELSEVSMISILLPKLTTPSIEVVPP